MSAGLGLSTEDLYLAYRQAKTALFYERRGVGLHEIAQFETDLPKQLRALKRTVNRRTWFDGIEMGESWIVPKRFREEEQTEAGLIDVGTSGERRRSIEVQVRVSPHPAFAIMEVLYLWQFGGLLDAQLASPEVLGYRLDTRNGSLSPTRRWLFEYWQRRYQEFRSAPLQAAKAALQDHKRVKIISADLASFYDTVDPSFMLSDEFVAKMKISHGDRFHAAAYRAATASLLDAFARFRSIASQRTGAAVPIGVPIGALTSRLVANLALAPLDERIATKRGVLCYRRYVDDIVIVARDSEKSRGVEDTLATYFPMQGRVEGVMRLDCAALNRQGSDFQLQTRKVRVHRLEGVAGIDFVDAVAADFSTVVSERRAFLDAATLHGDGASHLIRARQSAGSPLRVLREADRARLERFALSTSLRSLERVSSLVDAKEATRLVRTNLEQVGRVLDAEGNWLDDLDVSLQLLRLALLARDWASAAELNKRMDSVWGSVETLRAAVSRLYFRGEEIPSARLSSWRWLRNYLHELRLEAVASAIPVAAKKRQLVEFLPNGLLRRTWRMTAKSVQRRASELAASDLRSRDREEDPKAETTKDLTWMTAELARSDKLRARFDLIDRFLKRCRALKDDSWLMSPARLFLCTRPPSYFDIARRWLCFVEAEGFDQDIFDGLLEIVNAVRGTQYQDPVGHAHNRSTVRIDSFLERDQFGPPAPGPRVMLGNLVVEDEAWMAAATRTPKYPAGRPQLTLKRLKGLVAILDQASEASRDHKASVLVLPELSVPRAWFRALSNHVVRAGRYGMVVGLEYWHDSARPHVSNQVYAVIPGPFSSVATWPWTKRVPAREEAVLLSQLPISLSFPTPKAPLPRTVIHSPWGNISVLICSELIEARRVSDLLGRADVILCPAWNRDTSSYDHLIQSVGFQLHSIIAIANNGHYSDCRAWAPRSERFERDLCRLIERGTNDVVHVDLPVASLLAFHKDPSKGKGWRPLPPDWP